MPPEVGTACRSWPVWKAISIMSRSTNRDLLFGLLALQNDFIDRDTLVDAFHRWTRDVTRPLGQVLLDRGALSTAQHALLAGLVEEHIKRNGGDAEKSLATLHPPTSVVDELARVVWPDLHASLALVSDTRTGPDDDPDRTATVLGESSSLGSRFRILRPHARGGLGQVSFALDRELDRPVALKEIQGRYADDPENRARFVEEAEITGKLEHPGIVPVYGMGHDGAGRPFYAMRFIQGESLKQAIAALHGEPRLKGDPLHRLERLRGLLRRYTDACNAVAYAHSRGVLHRDLKPANIMLGPYGETLVVDWGLAKPVAGLATAESSGAGPPRTDGPIRLSAGRPSREETAAGQMVGTPAYASPEQVAGRIDRLGPASDVYGLGATLYALLTGRAPVESVEIAEILRRVERGDIPRPRSIDPAIPKPLEAICRKAMAVRPEDRYTSARELSDDMTRWMDDQPVKALREGIVPRVRRWARKRPGWAIIVGLLLAIDLAFLVSAALTQDREKSSKILELLIIYPAWCLFYWQASWALGVILNLPVVLVLGGARGDVRRELYHWSVKVPARWFKLTFVVNFLILVYLVIQHL
jgi:serine/threonine-protein kinase